jgi:hypothetical protein
MPRSSFAVLFSTALAAPAAPAAAQTASPVPIRFAQPVCCVTPAATLAH